MSDARHHMAVMGGCVQMQSLEVRRAAHVDHDARFARGPGHCAGGVMHAFGRQAHFVSWPQALMDLHDDDDFQRDAVAFKLKDVIEELKADPEAMER
jgi:hypothetical protein